MPNINDEGFLELSGLHESGSGTGLNAENFPILQGITPLSLRVLSQSSRMLRVSQGVELLRAGDMSHDVYFILEGSVSIYKGSGDTQTKLARVMAGDFYGEYAAIKAKPRLTSVYTEEPCKIIRIDAKVLLQVFDSDSGFKDRVYEVMKVRILKTFLSNNPVFKTLSPQLRSSLITELKMVELERGSTLFSEGDSGKNFYIIVSGEAEISLGSQEYATVLGVRRAHDVLGEVRSNEGKTYGYSVWAANDLDLLVIDKAAMQSIKKLSEDIMPLFNQVMNRSAKLTAEIIKKVKSEEPR